MKQWFGEYVDCEVYDTHELQYEKNLLLACKHLKILMNKGHKVYIMAQAGFSRAQTLALLYLSLEKKSKKWHNLEHLWELLSLVHPICPNTEIVEKILERHGYFEVIKEYKQMQEKELKQQLKEFKQLEKKK